MEDELCMSRGFGLLVMHSHTRGPTYSVGIFNPRCYNLPVIKGGAIDPPIALALRKTSQNVETNIPIPGETKRTSPLDIARMPWMIWGRCLAGSKNRKLE